MTINAKLLRWIRAGLAQPGTTNAGLAKALDLDPASITRMVRGERRMRVDEIEPAASYFGMRPPAGFDRQKLSAAKENIPISKDLHKAIMARAMDLNVDPDEFVARAVRAALFVCGQKIGRGRY